MKKKKNEDLNISQEDLKKFGEEHIKQYKDELAVLESIDQANSVNILPMAIHNLSVIVPMQSYKFLKPIYSLYAAIDLRCHKDEEFKKVVRDMKERLYQLVHEEEEAFDKQAKKVIADARSKHKKINIDDESAYFEHVVYDPSREYHLFTMMIVQGMQLNEDHHTIIERLNSLVHNMCRERIIITKKAIENCEILAR